MIALIQRSELVSLLPLSFVQHLVDRGELGLLKVGDVMPMEPIGLLQPQADMRDAAARLAGFLRQRRDAAPRPRRT